MDRDELVSIEEVVAISEGLALICEVGGRRVSVPCSQIDPASDVQRPGDRGRLVIPRWLATNLGLLGGRG